MQKLGIGFLMLVLAQIAEARPEYTIQTNTVSCTTCHLSPSGAQHRNVFGKMYGSFGRPPGPNSSSQSYYGDLRALLYVPEKAEQTSNGLVLMSAYTSVATAVTEPEQSPVSAVLSYNFGSLARDTGDVYLKWDLGEKTLLLGKFLAPFGLLTDEHRTYTRMLTRTGIRDYSMGFMYSETTTPNFHWDLALTNGSQANSFNNGEVAYALYANARWMDFQLPTLIGTSLSSTGTSQRKEKLEAASLYNIWILPERIRPKMALSLEAVLTQGYSDSTRNSAITSFIPSSFTSYLSELSNSTGVAGMLEFKYYLKPHMTVSYKYDHLLPDKRYTGDSFALHGIRFKHWFNSNMSGLIHFEKAEIKRPGINKLDSKMGRDSFFAVLQAWI